MSKRIDRVAFFFQDGEIELNALTHKMFPYSNLLGNLINEVYDGRRIQFVNVFFQTESTYSLFPALKKHYTHFYKNHFAYYDVFEYGLFNILNYDQQVEYIWNKACDNLIEGSQKVNNLELHTAVKYAKSKGLSLGLDPDFPLLEENIILSGILVKASIWIVFKDGNMCSKLVLTKGGAIIYESELDGTVVGFEAFFDLYKKITVKNNTIFIKGSKHLESPITKIDINPGILI